MALSLMHSNKCTGTVLIYLYLIYNKHKSVRNVTIDKITAESELLYQSTLSLGKNKPPLIVKHIFSSVNYEGKKIKK